MEHRWSTRKPYGGRVLVESPEGSLFGRARDIGLDGMFLETDGVVLAVNTPITVGFRLADEVGACEFRLPAMVVRRAPIGIGILFLEMPEDVGEALRDALYRNPYGRSEQSAEIVLTQVREVSSRALVANG